MARSRKVSALLTGLFLILIDVAYAELPVIIDPFFTTQQKYLATEGKAFDNFGNSVAIDGNTAVIGAFRDGDGTESGAAYVFTRIDGIWGQTQKLIPADISEKDLFGRSVAIDGNVILISSLADDDNGLDSGSAYIFEKKGKTWVEQQKLLPADGGQGDQAGWSVDVSGNTALIGVWLDDDNGQFSGSAYVFVKDGDIWIEQQKLLPDDGKAEARFGISVSISGETVLISAMVDDELGAEAGSAYIFTRTAGVWTQKQKLLASDGAEGDRFGISVSLDSGTAMIGSWHDDDLGSDSGSVYVFEYDLTSWVETDKLIPADGAAGEEFGYSVSISGDTTVVGAFSDDDHGITSGSAYVYRRINGNWLEEQKLAPADGLPGDQFGVSVAIDGYNALSGAWWSDDIGDTSGSVYFYTTDPVCDINLSQLSYIDGDSVMTEKFRLLSSTGLVESVEWKAWLSAPTQDLIPVINRGSDGSFILAPGTDFDIGNMQLFTVNQSMKRGDYQFNCRFINPSTGATLSLDENTFKIK